jgi:hypothetical protein
MYKVDINKKVIDAMGLSDNERRVFEALIAYPMPNSLPKLVRDTGLPRSTIRDVLVRLEERKLVKRVMSDSGKRCRWLYVRGIEKIGKYGAYSQVFAVMTGK